MCLCVRHGNDASWDMVTWPIKIQEFLDRTKSHILYSDHYVRLTVPLINALVNKKGQKYSINELTLDVTFILNLIIHSCRRISVSRVTVIWQKHDSFLTVLVTLGIALPLMVIYRFKPFFFNISEYRHYINRQNISVYCGIPYDKGIHVWLVKMYWDWYNIWTVFRN
jgi:hypothetical protein